jgi:hypothetical protein
MDRAIARGSPRPLYQRLVEIQYLTEVQNADEHGQKDQKEQGGLEHRRTAFRSGVSSCLLGFHGQLEPLEQYFPK